MKRAATCCVGSFFVVVVLGGCAKREPVVAPTTQFPEPWARNPPPSSVAAAQPVSRMPDSPEETETIKHDLCDPIRAKASAGSSATDREDLAICEESLGKLIDALRNAQRALELGIQNRDAAVMASSRNHVKSLLNKIPHITFSVDTQQQLERLMVTFDGRPVPIDALHKKFSVDPGRHEVMASATDKTGQVLRQSTVLTVNESDFITVPIRPQ